MEQHNEYQQMARFINEITVAGSIHKIRKKNESYFHLCTFYDTRNVSRSEELVTQCLE